MMDDLAKASVYTFEWLFCIIYVGLGQRMYLSPVRRPAPLFLLRCNCVHEALSLSLPWVTVMRAPGVVVTSSCTPTVGRTELVEVIDTLLSLPGDWTLWPLS